MNETELLLDQLKAKYNALDEDTWLRDGNRILADDPRSTIICQAGGSEANPAVIADLDFIVFVKNNMSAILQRLERRVG